MKYICFCVLCLSLGCNTTKIQSTKQWEGHYYNVDEFKKATEKIDLQKNESIWVLSDRTLNRVLKNIERQ